MTATPIALSIAGSDSGGGAGIQADLKTFSALQTFGTVAITALTAQNTQGVQAVYPVSTDFVVQQIQAVCEDIGPTATKIGMLANKEIIAAVAKTLDKFKFKIKSLVLDPVMVAQSGDPLLEEDAVATLKQELIPRATLITPNIPEAAKLLDIAEEEVLAQPQQTAEALLQLGSEAVLLKGGHAHNSAAPTEITDHYLSGQDKFSLTNPHIPTAATHGSGCTLAAAITAYLARQESLPNAVKQGNEFVHNAIKHAAKLNLGKGAGPVHHLHNRW